MKKGFTLIEILIVISILGILSSIVVVSLNSARNKAKDSIIKSQLSSARIAGGLALSNDDYGLATTDNGCEGLISSPSFGDLMSLSAWPEIDGEKVLPICYSDASAGDKISAYSMWHAQASGGGWCVDSTGKSINKNVNPDSPDCGEADLLEGGSVACSAGIPGYTITGNMTPDVTGNYYENGNINGQAIYSRDTGTYSIFFDISNLWLIGPIPGYAESAAFFQATGPHGEYPGINGGTGTAIVTYDDCLPIVESIPPIGTLPILPSITFNGAPLYIHPTDNSTGVEWGCSGSIVNATSTSDGRANTLAFMANCNQENVAPKICADLNYGGYSDWYLPAQDQLLAMRSQKDTVNKGDYSSEWQSYLANTHWWSSTEDPSYPSTSVMVDYLDSLSPGMIFLTLLDNKGGFFRVRCVR